MNIAPRKLRRVLRLIGWNALLLLAGLALIGLAGEAWLRWTVPSMSIQGHSSRTFVSDVGVLMPPDTEIRWTNGPDFQTVSRTNSLGFLDREPPSPERAAEGCHIAMIGDSFVEAPEVPIPKKFHVRLEEMAARELPALDVTTSAFGKGGTGQIAQLAYYDEYVRPLRPKLIVLVFVPNDYTNNYPLWMSLRHGWDPGRLPYVSAVRAENGGFRLRPPDPDYRRFRSPRPWWREIAGRAIRASRILSYLRAKLALLFHEPDVRPKAETATRRYVRTWIANEDEPRFYALFTEGNDSPSYTEALAFTAFGLDEFKKRAERDGAALIILASHRMSYFGGSVLARLEEMTAERGIPVVKQGDFILRRGAELRDAEWANDAHWNPTGHRWAAEALLEYLKRNQDVCE